MNRSLVLSTVLSISFAFSGLAVAEPSSATLEKSVTDLLVQKLGDDAKTIKVAVVKGKLILTGEVTSRATAELAKEVAIAVPGVKKVDNQVSAKAGKSVVDGKVGDEIGDAKVETAIESALKKEIGDHAKKVDVEFVSGVALLRGKVPDAARKDLAIKTATGIEGVKQVIDLISVAK